MYEYYNLTQIKYKIPRDIVFYISSDNLEIYYYLFLKRGFKYEFIM
jgi:hypothetical protein